MNLNKSIAAQIKNAIFQNKKIEKVILFGSRAKETAREGSDIDLALVGKDLHFRDLCDLGAKLDGLNLPYRIDFVPYDKISNPNLKEHIDRVGIVL